MENRHVVFIFILFLKILVFLQAQRQMFKQTLILKVPTPAQRHQKLDRRI